MVISNRNRFYVTIRNISSYEGEKAIAEARGKRYFRIVLDSAPRFKISRPAKRKRKGNLAENVILNSISILRDIVLFYNGKIEFLAKVGGLCYLETYMGLFLPR